MSGEPRGAAHARIYDDLFVPAEFRAWVPRMIEAGSVSGSDRVLDVACGTGVLTREAARCVGPGGFVAGLDPDPGMLAVAAERAAAIEWRLGSAESIPYPDASFDVVVCQFGLMFFHDRMRAVREMLRVLIPGGRLAAAVWDRVEHTPPYAALIDVAAGVAGRTAADALRQPFDLGDRDALAALFHAAGAADVAITTHEETSDFPSARALVDAELLGWLPTVGIAVPPSLAERIGEDAERRLADHVTPEGRLRFRSPAHIVTARRPPDPAPVARASG